MNIIVLHGDFVTKSRERLERFIRTARAREWEVVRLSDSKLSLAEQLRAGSLFGKERLFVLENIKNVSKKDFEWLKLKSDDLVSTLVVYSEGLVPKKTLQSFGGKVKIEEFKLPRIIFTFLDGLYPNNSKRALVLFHELLKNEPVEFIFALVAKQTRDLYWVKVEPNSLNYPQWRKNKLQKQSEKFSKGALESLIREMAEIDIEAKTSSANLPRSIDLLVATYLE